MRRGEAVLLLPSTPTAFLLRALSQRWVLRALEGDEPLEERSVLRQLVLDLAELLDHGLLALGGPDLPLRLSAMADPDEDRPRDRRDDAGPARLSRERHGSGFS